MRNFISILVFLIISVNLRSQTPSLINYQGVVRDAAGTPISGVTNPLISVKFELYSSVTGGTAGFSETQQNIPLSSLGLFNTQIGKVAGNLNAVNWATGSWYLEVFIDLNNGSNPTSSLGRQQLVSTPYALYAEKAGNAGTTYSAGPGIVISGNIISNTLVPITPTITGSGLAVVSPTVGNVFNVNIPPASIVYNQSSNILSLTQGTNVSTAAFPTVSTTSVYQVSPGISVTGNSTNGYTVANNATVSISFSGPTAGIINSGNGNSSSFALPSPTLNAGQGISIGGAWPVQTISAVSSGSSGAVWSTLGNLGTDPSVNFIGTSDATDLVFKTNNAQQAVLTSAGNLGLGVASPLSKLDLSATSGTLINASMTGGTGINVDVNSGGGISSTNTSGTSSAIYGRTTGGASSIKAEKLTGAGNALRVDYLSNISLSPAVYVVNSGGGAGIEINSNATSTVGLQLTNGHFKASGSPGAISCTLSSFDAPANFSFSGAWNDVKGRVTVNFISPSIPAGGSTDIKVPFVKGYSFTPAVVITPAFANLNCYVIGATSTDFVVRFVNNSGGSINTTSFGFNYFVIE